MRPFSKIFQHCAFNGIMKRKWDSESHLRVKVRFWMGIRLCHSKLLSHFRIHWEYSRYSWFTRQTAKKRKGSWSSFCASRSRKSSKTFFLFTLVKTRRKIGGLGLETYSTFMVFLCSLQDTTEFYKPPKESSFDVQWDIFGGFSNTM